MSSKKKQLQRSRIYVVEGMDLGCEWIIDKERVTIGQSVICNLVLQDRDVHGLHCEIITTDQGCIIHDLGSPTGTFVSEVRIREAWLVHGAMIRVGQTVLCFERAEGTVEIDLSQNKNFFNLEGSSVRMREIFAVLEKISSSELTVLVCGETGTGKELVARAIHRASSRSRAPLIVQDCSAIPGNLIEDTLFGHERGAFTGAHERYKGSFEQADGGTIFLDEIGELNISLQPKLLRVLESREIKRVGGDRTVPVNVRVIAATNRDLRQMVNEGTFREDLFYRLSVVQLDLPPLRERKEDIPMLVQSFLQDFSRRKLGDENRNFTVTTDAMARLLSYPWPGNIRELKNTVERAVSLSESSELTVRDLTPVLQKTPPAIFSGATAEQLIEDGIPFKDAKQKVLNEFEYSYLKVLVEKYAGNISKCAKAADLTRFHLRELVKRHGIYGDHNP